MSNSRRNKRKKWDDNRSRKLQQKWYGREERIKNQGGLRNLEQDKVYYDKSHQLIAKVPENFSLIHNTEETVKYFNHIISVIEKKCFKQKFYINAFDVEYVTTEALIYMIAVVYNIKANRALQYSFEGNLPFNRMAREVFEKSGYLNYFKMKRLKMPDSSECVQIVSGNLVDPHVAQHMCDFVISKLQIDREKTRVLYATLIELMSNTAKHAYKAEQKEMLECWYLYAIYKDEKITFSFVDTGQGIPRTIKKKYIEKVNPTITDAQLIKLALTDSGRSETRLPNRGKGLPQLYGQVQNNNISDFFVLSGAGSCTFEKANEELTLSNFPHRIYGTIFSFSIKREDYYV